MAKRKVSALLQEARQRYDLVETADAKQYARELAACRFAARDQWPADMKRLRAGTPPGGAPTNATSVPARPTLVIDKTMPVIMQLVNELASAHIGIELVQAGDFQSLVPQGDDTELKLREGLLRRIQRETEATDARLWAYQRAVTCGRGYYGISTKYIDKAGEGASLFDQEIVYQRFLHQEAVALDPAHTEPDGSDAEWGFVTETMSWAEYAATYGERNGTKNRVCGYDKSDFRRANEQRPLWWELTADGKPAAVRIVNYWYTEFESRDMVLLATGEEMPASEAPEDVEVLQRRSVLDRHVKWCKFDGCDDDVLEETEWVSPYIPIIKVLGRELIPVDGERCFEGVVQPMMDPCQAENYVLSKFVETIGLTPISQIMIPVEGIEGVQDWWNSAAVRTWPYLPYNHKDDAGQPIPSPSRVPSDPSVQPLAMAIQIFKEAIKDVSSMPDPSLGSVDPTVKSGKLATTLIEQSRRATRHFIENMRRSMAYDGKQANAMLYAVYGGRPGRMTRIVNGHNQGEVAVINAPAGASGPLPEGVTPPKPFTLTEDFDADVTIKVDRSFDTLREQEAARLGELIGANPEFMTWFGDLFFKNTDGPGHEEIAERAKLMLAPPIQMQLQQGAPIPPQVAMQMQQMVQQAQASQEELAKLKLEKAGGVVKGQFDLQKTQLQIQSDQQIERFKGAIALQIEQMQQGMAELKLVAENLRTAAAFAEERRLSHADKAHEVGVQAHQHAHDRREREAGERDAERGRAHDREMSDRGHLQTLEQQAAQPTKEPV